MSDRERQILCFHLYVESKIQSELTNITKRKQIHRYREQTSVARRRSGGWMAK